MAGQNQIIEDGIKLIKKTHTCKDMGKIIAHYGRAPQHKYKYIYLIAYTNISPLKCKTETFRGFVQIKVYPIGYNSYLIGSYRPERV